MFSEFAVYVFMPRVLLCEADPEMPRKATTVPEDWDDEGNWVPRLPTPNCGQEDWYENGDWHGTATDGGMAEDGHKDQKASDADGQQGWAPHADGGEDYGAPYADSDPDDQDDADASEDWDSDQADGRDQAHATRIRLQIRMATRIGLHTRMARRIGLQIPMARRTGLQIRMVRRIGLQIRMRRIGLQTRMARRIGLQIRMVMVKRLGPSCMHLMLKLKIGQMMMAAMRYAIRRTSAVDHEPFSHMLFAGAVALHTRSSFYAFLRVTS